MSAVLSAVAPALRSSAASAGEGESAKEEASAKAGKLDETCLVLDPPRSGCGKLVLKTLREQKPRKIIYVSCAPPMLARNIKELLRFGYKLERVTPFDMFPQTAHCEAVAELTRL